MVDENGGERIAYTAKQLFEKIDEKLDKIVVELDRKADRVTVEALAGQLRAVESKLIEHEAVRAATVPEFLKVRDQVDQHVRQPHSASEKHEERIRDLEQWKSAIPVATLVAAVSAVGAVVAAVLK